MGGASGSPGIASGPGRGSGRRPALPVRGLALLLPAFLIGCGAPAAGPEAGPACAVIGGPGTAPGRFVTPRALAIAGGSLWVVDRSGRVQGFDRDGGFRREIRISDADRGFPVGILGSADGGFLLCDTHASVLRTFSAAGEETGRLGGPGSGPGRFAAPQRAARDAEGRLYVSEYGTGDANRVQVFAPGGGFVTAFGGFGHEPGRFSRPMGIAVHGDEVFVADVTDRILVFRRDGAFLREFGRPGSGVGELRYPYGLCARDGVLYVCEYGNHRLQRFARDGRSLGCFGAPGSGPGRFHGPWDLTVSDDGRLFVCDTGNHRVVVYALRDIPWSGGSA